MKRRFYASLVLIATISLLNSCHGGGGGGTTTNSYTATSGVAQKGPLQMGSIVTAQELDANLSPTGKQYSYQIDSDLGTFSPTSTFTSQYIGLNATGYYFDEVANGISAGPITLNAISDLSTDTVLNVNLLTTLTYQRIVKLVTNSGMAFADARSQAENEVLAALNIRSGNSFGNFGSLDISKGRDGDKMLAAISSIFVSGNSPGTLSSLIANFQSDIADNGVIDTAATTDALVTAAKNLDSASVASNLTQKYASTGASYTATDISDWIDRDGDGLIGKYKFQVSGVTSRSTFTFPSYVVNQVAGAPISLTAGQLLINGTPVTGDVTVNAGDVVAVTVSSADALATYLMSGTTRIARVFFVFLNSINITPVNPSVGKGLTQQLQATGINTDGTSYDITASVIWSSSTTTVATISQSGLATGAGAGTTTITATVGPISVNTTLTVPPTGVIWTARTSGTTASLFKVAWAGAQFASVGAAGTILTSPDGVTWTTRTSGTAADLFNVTWSGTQFVAVGAAGTILSSPEGITWTARTSGTTKDLHGITWSGTLYVAVGDMVILSSPDGITWTESIFSPPIGPFASTGLSAIAWSGTQFVAVSPGGEFTNNYTVRSSNGITWTTGGGSGIDIVWSGTQFVVAASLEAIYRSPDGISWLPTSKQATPSGDFLHGIAWSGTQFVAVGGGGVGKILSSPDGNTWTDRAYIFVPGNPSPINQIGFGVGLNGVTWSGTQFVTVGYNGKIFTSQ